MYRPTPPFLVAMAAVLALVTFSALADDTLTWKHPTQYVADAAGVSAPLPLSDIAMTVIRYGNGTTANPPTSVSSVTVPAPATSVVVPRDPLLAGTVCYQAATVTTPASPGAGAQSVFAPSAWLCKTIAPPPPKKPKAPTNLTVQ